MDSVHTVRLRCSTCGQPGLAHWEHPESGRAGARRLLGITQGFSAMTRGGRQEPEILCLKCTDIPCDGRIQMAAQSAE